MREIIDNLYLFSLSADSYGEVIALRTRGNADTEGEDVFKLLGIGAGELQFLNQTDRHDYNSPCLVMGRRGGEDHCVLIDIFTSLELPMGLAMEIPRPCRAIGATYNGKNWRVSPLAQKLIDKYVSADCDPQTDMSVSRSVASLFDLAQAASSDGDISVRLSNMLSFVAELVCLPIECSVIGEDLCEEGESILLHANACLFITVAMAMAARKYSPDRKLYALISMQFEFISISLAYECVDVAWRGERLLRSMIEEGDMICELCMRDGKMICSMAPCYADEGLAGVKEQLSALQMLEFWR